MVQPCVNQDCSFNEQAGTVVVVTTCSYGDNDCDAAATHTVDSDLLAIRPA